MPTNTPTLTDFDALLEAARQQSEPQRLLFVFAHKAMPEHPTTQQWERFERGEGGSLRPCLCVDKTSHDVPDSAALAAESTQTGQHWDVVFVGSLEGRGGITPNSDEASQPCVSWSTPSTTAAFQNSRRSTAKATHCGSCNAPEPNGEYQYARWAPQVVKKQPNLYGDPSLLPSETNPHADIRFDLVCAFASGLVVGVDIGSEPYRAL